MKLCSDKNLWKFCQKKKLDFNISSVIFFINAKEVAQSKYISYINKIFCGALC